MKILVTGGGGFLGSAVCRQLVSLGHEVTAYQRRDTGLLQDLGVRGCRGDICDAHALGNAAAGSDAVIHTAAKAGIWGKAFDYRRINIDGTRNVIRVCRDAGIPVLVHTSSPSVVQGNVDVEGGDESLPLGKRFTAPYPETKAEAERLVLAANGAGLKTTALRPHLIWGPGDPHILPRLADKARHGRLHLPGADKRVDTIFVENAALAHVQALQDLLGNAKCAGKAYFVTNDEPLPQGEIMQRLLQAIGIEVQIRPVPAWLARAAASICEATWRSLKLNSEPPITRFSAEQLCTAHWYDISAAKRDLGYRPRYSIAEGLSQLRVSHAGAA